MFYIPQNACGRNCSLDTGLVKAIFATPLPQMPPCQKQSRKRIVKSRSTFNLRQLWMIWWKGWGLQTEMYCKTSAQIGHISDASALCSLSDLFYSCCNEQVSYFLTIFLSNVSALEAHDIGTQQHPPLYDAAVDVWAQQCCYFKAKVVPDQSSSAKQTRCLVSHRINETLFRGGNGDHGLIASAQWRSTYPATTPGRIPGHKCNISRSFNVISYMCSEYRAVSAANRDQSSFSFFSK